jgi:unsaturated chondroitin disaccharide hydrolase
MNKMHKRLKSLLFLSVFVTGFLFSCKTGITEKKLISHAENQILVMLEEISRVKQYGNAEKLVSPRALDSDGNLVLVPTKDWTSGFFPGVMWYLYELTGNEMWYENAREYTKPIEIEKFNGGTHDMGFKIYCSFGNSYRLTGETWCREVIIEAATKLSERFNPVTGCIRSWDHNAKKWNFPVIIDNLMNLELLFAATRLTGDPSFHQIAVSHADKTIQNHFRGDFSTWHVVDYDTFTGEVVKKNTHQGLNDNSTWSRGQAWALYGYTLCYRETTDKKYLRQAENIAGFILNHPNLPDDLVPYWDFDAPNIPDEPSDASAASIMASAFFELSTYSKNGALYKEKAETILRNLTNGYLSEKNGAKGFILMHSTGSAPSNKEVDVPLIYSDYYFLEALIRANRLKEGKPVV